MLVDGRVLVGPVDSLGPDLGVDVPAMVRVLGTIKWHVHLLVNISKVSLSSGNTICDVQAGPPSHPTTTLESKREMANS